LQSSHMFSVQVTSQGWALPQKLLLMTSMQFPNWNSGALCRTVTCLFEDSAFYHDFV
jgi:hypothetical protein